MSGLADRARALRQRLRIACESCGRDPEGVEILAVSKFQPLDSIREALGLGFTSFGENYVQEGMAKAQALPEARFLLQGPIQRNKAKAALLHFQELLTLDRLELLERLARLAEELDVVRPVWIQVDLWNEATKMGGCTPRAIPDLVTHLEPLPRLPFQGFMAIPPPEEPSAFLDLAALRNLWQDRLGRSLRLSMGMSHDLEEAVAAGSDQVRIGTALFGGRT